MVDKVNFQSAFWRYVVIFWTLLILGLLAGQYSGIFHYKIPTEVTTTYIVVLGILAITKKSKSYFVSKD